MERQPTFWKINIPKISILPYMTDRFNAVPIKITFTFFEEILKIFKLILNQLRPQIAKAILSKQSKASRITIKRLSYNGIPKQ
jgi:hypothetical protein